MTASAVYLMQGWKTLSTTESENRPGYPELDNYLLGNTLEKTDVIAEWKDRYSSYSDEKLIEEKHQWLNSSERHIAAVQLLHEHQKERDVAKHKEILTQFKQHHWSIIPGFWINFIAMVAACIAAYASLFPFQAQGLASSILKSLPGVPSMHMPTSNSQPPSAHSPQEPISQQKK